MGLISRGRGRGRGGTCSFTGLVNQRPWFNPNPPCAGYSPAGFPIGTSPGVPQLYNAPPKHKLGPPRRGFGRFPRNHRNHFIKNVGIRNKTHVFEIDLTKPWITDEIKSEENKKQEILQLWKENKSSEIWAQYEAQKLAVQALHDRAKAEYAASHPNEAVLWGNTSTNKQYYCETCDKSFRTEEDLFVHESEHETCGREGCEFTAHPKLIAKHIKMQHDSGLFKRIGKLYTDEDIKKWIEERKKRYPTRKLVEEKKILEQEKINRGERIKESDSKFNKSFSHRNRLSGKKNFEKKTHKNTRNHKTKKNKKVSIIENLFEEETSAIRKGIPAFPGTKTESSKPIVPVKDELNISDEEWETVTKPQTDTKPLLNSSLGLLATLYDSEEEVENKTEPNKEIVLSDEGSGPEEVSSKTPLPDQINDVPKKRKFVRKKENQNTKRRNTFNDNHVEKRSLTLLEKLLKNEIRHERNVILQCVHYVVKNNFFKS